MAGTTGKMTAEAIAQRGPRKVLYYIRKNGELMKVICRYGQPCFKDTLVLCMVTSMAKSYDTRYLLRIGKGN